MWKRRLVLFVVSMICLAALVLALSPNIASEQNPPRGIKPVTWAQSEVVSAPPETVLTWLKQRPDTTSLGPAHIAYICCSSEPAEHEYQLLEVWSRNVDSISRMLFSRITIDLPDGSQVWESIGCDVRPGEWMHATYPMPRVPAGAEPVEYTVTLTEPGPFFEYVHDCRRGQAPSGL